MTAGSIKFGDPATARPSFWLSTETVLAGAILFCVALQLHLAFTKSINWDEFRFYADLHKHARGELSDSLQTFHVHLFGWLLRLPLSEVDQIIAGRLAMLAIEGGTVALIYRCARHFMPNPAALLSVLAYLSFSFVVEHGASFRFDPPSIALLMAAAALLLEPRLRRRSMIIAGLAVAAAGLITIKSAFMLPTLGALALARLAAAPHRRHALARLALMAATAAGTFAILYAVHKASLSAAELDAAGGLVAHSAGQTLGHGALLPRGSTVARAVIENPLVVLLLAAGLWRTACAAMRRRGAERTRALMLLAFALPLLTPLVYGNAYAYYYAWMLAPAVVLAGATPLGRDRQFSLVAALLALSAIAHRGSEDGGRLERQRETMAAVHALFPRPVAYIDRASMVGSFRKVGPFMSRWGMTSYRAAGQPLMRDLLARHTPPLLITNSPILLAALGQPAAPERNKPPLLAADAAVLRANYIPHWGPLWVAGKRLVASGEVAAFEVLIGGRYRIETDRPVMIDGVAHLPGAVVTLMQGPHRISSTDGRQTVVLRWASLRPGPASAPPSGDLFPAGF